MEDFVLYNEGLALEELGFNEPCLAFFNCYKENELQLGEGYNYVTRHYRENVMEYKLINSEIKNRAFNPIRGSVTAPTYSQAFRWFRKEFMLRGEVTHADSNGSCRFTVWKWNFDNNIGKWQRIPSIATFNTWEEAELKCLQKLIELSKEINLVNSKE